MTEKLSESTKTKENPKINLAVAAEAEAKRNQPPEANKLPKPPNGHTSPNFSASIFTRSLLFTTFSFNHYSNLTLQMLLNRKLN